MAFFLWSLPSLTVFILMPGKDPVVSLRMTRGYTNVTGVSFTNGLRTVELIFPVTYVLIELQLIYSALFVCLHEMSSVQGIPVFGNTD